MHKIENLWIGWIDTSITYLFRNIPELIARFAYVLVTSIDSYRDLRTLEARGVVHESKECRFLSGGIVLPGKLFLEVIFSGDLFNGFDEIWLFDHPPSMKLPDEIWITGPRKITENIPKGLDKWMAYSGCIVGMGDGMGLNYVTTDKGIAELLGENQQNKK